MPTKLTEEQRTAILEQSEGMSKEEKQAFANSIKGAQTKQEAKTPAPVIEKAPVEQTNVVDNNNGTFTTTLPTAPKKEPAVIKDTGVVRGPFGKPLDEQPKKEEKLKDIGAREGAASQIKEAFSALANSDRTKSEAIEEIKSKFEGKGFDVSKFESQFADSIAEFDSLDLSSDEFFSGLMTGESYNKAIQNNSADYTVAKQQFDSFNALDKTEDGIYRALKGNTLDRTILGELNKNPETAEFIRLANEKIAQDGINEQLMDKSIGEVLKLNQEDKAAFIKAIFGEFGLDRDFQKELDDNESIAKSKEEYSNANRSYLEAKNKKASLLNKIKRENPNGSPSYINALYNRELGILTDEQNQALTDMGVAKGSYDIEFGELEYVNNLQIAQSDKQLAAYNNLLTKEWDLYSTEEKGIIKNKQAQEHQKELNKIEQEYGAYTSKTDKNGDLVFFDRNGTEKKRFKKFDLAKSNIVTDEEIMEDGSRRINQFDKTTGEYIGSYILGAGPNEGKIFGGAEIKDGETNILQGDFRRNINLTRPEGSTNVARDTNNPGNITVPEGYTNEQAERLGRALGANGTYTSPNGREYYVFPDVNSGVKGMKDMIGRQVEGNSSWANPKMSIENYIIGYEHGPKFIMESGGDWQKAGVPRDYFFSIMDDLGAKGWEELSDFDSDDISNAIAKAEGFGDISGANGGTEWSSFEESEIKGLIKGGTIGERADKLKGYKNLRQEGFSHNEAKNYTIPKNAFKDETSLRKEFEIRVGKDARTSLSKAEQINKIFESGATGPGDMAAIFAFMKGLDPTSVVRESEYAAAAKTAGALDRLKTLQLIEKWKTGVILTPQQRKDFVNVTKAVSDANIAIYNREAKEFKRIAEQSGLNPDNVVFDNLGNYPQSSTQEETKEIIYTDDDGIEYNQENLNKELNKMLKEGLFTSQEQVQEWIKNNIKK